MECLEGVLRALRRLEGVEAARLRIERSLITIKPRLRAMIDLASLPAVIQNGSTGGERYSMKRLWIQAIGILNRAGSAATFRILGWPAAFRIEGPAPEDPVHSDDGLVWLNAEVLLADGVPRLKVLQASRAP